MKSIHYFRLILNSIYDVLKESWNRREKIEKICPELLEDFEIWLSEYWKLQRDVKNHNDAIFDTNDEKEYSKAIIYYISGMTDNYAISMYNKIIEFGK